MYIYIILYVYMYNIYNITCVILNTNNT